MDDLTIYLILLLLIWIPVLCRGKPKEEEWIIEAVIPADYPQAQTLKLEEIDIEALIEEEIRRRSQPV